MQHAINGARMHWREAGTGEPVLFIHGFPFHSAMWEPQLAEIPEGWRFIAPDLRGFGESEPGPADRYTIDLFADDLIGLLDHLDVEQVVVCGLSMGGYVALSLIDRYPDRVRALVLAATRAGADSADAKRGRLELAARVRSEGAAPVVESMLPKLISGNTRHQRPELEQQLRTMVEAAAPESLARALEAMATRKDRTDRLGAIDVSTMVVRGDQDELIPAGDMELIARSVRGTRHEVIQNVGHLPNLEAPDVFNSTLRQFLNFLPPALKLGDLSLNF